MFVTVCNKEYLIGFEVMLKSLVENNPRVIRENIPFTIISNDLTSDDLITSKKIHNNILLKTYDSSKYREIDELKKQQMSFGDYANPKITNDLINLTKLYGITEHSDQDIINYYFQDVIEDFPIEYNFLKTYNKSIFQNTGLPKYIKIFHYIVKKPWQNKPLVFLEEGTIWTEKYWFEYYSKILKLKNG